MKLTRSCLALLLLSFALVVGCGASAEPYDAEAAAADSTELSPEEAASEPSSR